MITLYTFGPHFGLPDPSPFVSKALVLLAMSGLEFRTDTTGFKKAPKGKLPYMDDAGTIIADSTFMRWHLEQRHGIDFDRGLSREQKAIGWAVEKMCEDNLYWTIMDQRWMDDANFDKGPRHYFDEAPAVVRPVVMGMVRRQIRRDLRGQGMGRHARADIERLAAASIDALAAIIGDKPWLLGSAPSGADATAWSFVANVLCDHFPGAVRDSAARHPTLAAYRDRGLQLWFPAGATPTPA